jgi:hypothetical protein
VQERELDARAAGEGGADAARPRPHLSSRLRQAQDDVGLPAALARPTGLGRIRDVYHVVVELFHTAEPGRSMRCGAHVPDQLRTARPAELGSELRGEFGHIDFIAVRNERENPRALRSRPCAVAARQAPRAKLRDGEGELRGLRGGGIQNGIRKEQQLRVPQRNHRGAARFLQQPPGLPHPLAAFDLGHHALVRSCAHPQPAARHQIYSVRNGAGREQQIARRQGEMDGTGREHLQNPGRHVLELG